MLAYSVQKMDKFGFEPELQETRQDQTRRDFFIKINMRQDKTLNKYLMQDEPRQDKTESLASRLARQVQPKKFLNWKKTKKVQNF